MTTLTDDLFDFDIKRRKQQREASRKWREQNPDKAREKCRKWFAKNRQYDAARKRAKRAANPEHHRAIARRSYRKNIEARLAASRERTSLARYGLTISDRQKMFEAQGFACAACGSTTPGSRRDWHTDHCHATGKVRGILCSGCNVALGNVGDSTERLRALIRYLDRHSVIPGSKCP